MAMFNAYSGDEDCHHQHQDIINKNVDLYVKYIHVLQKSNKRQNYNQRGDVT